MTNKQHGYFISTKVLVIVSSIVIVIYIATILGLVFGLNTKCGSTSYPLVSDDKIYYQCKTLACKNKTLFEEINNQCKSSVPVVTTTIEPSTLSSTSSTSARLNYRLPTALKPYYYHIRVNTTFDSLTEPTAYNGHVEIKFQCVEKTFNLTLNMRDLNIDNSSITIKDLENTTFQNANIKTWQYDSIREFLIISLPVSFEVGHNYSVSIKYSGQFRTDNTGFYRSSYIDNESKRKWLITSHMTPMSARKAFPCFDERAMKAVFKLTVIHHKSLKARSNLPSIGVKDAGNNLVETDFDESLPMSSYLIALVISDFECLSGIAKAGIKGSVDIRVCARPNAVNQLNYALNAAIRSIEFFEDLTKVKYPLPKCDHIAVPAFNPGGMENWGSIIYKESNILYNERTTPIATQQQIATYIAHETSHLWFGDLVCAEWWNDLWLDQGFATYMEYLGVNNVNSTFEMNKQFVETLFKVIERDSYSDTHAVSISVETLPEINGLFDDIAYQKGAALVNMLNYILGVDTFYKGIEKYFNKYKYTAVKADNLWETLDEQAIEDIKLKDLNLTDVMQTWSLLAGHPLVSIYKVNSSTYTISQSRFYFDRPIEKSSDKWYVPFTYSIEKIDAQNEDTLNSAQSNLFNRIDWLKPDEEKKTINLERELENDEFLLANLKLSGFYRVNYDDENWLKIIRQLKTRKDAIPIENRAQIVNDAFSLLQVNLINATIPFEISKYLKNEIDYVVWTVAIDRLNLISNLIDSTSVYGEYQAYTSSLIEKLYGSVGWDDGKSSTWLENRLRPTVLSFACTRGLKKCVDAAKDLFSKWISSDNVDIVPANYRLFVYGAAIRNGNENDWEFAFRKYKTGQTYELGAALCCAKQPWLVLKFLEYQLKSIEVNQIPWILISCASEPQNQLLTWNFFKENWQTFYSKLGNSGNFGRFISIMVSKFNKQVLLDDFDRFFNSITIVQSDIIKEVKNAKEKIKGNFNWIDKNFKTIETWLKDNI